MANKEKIVFYFPWKELSGGPYYLTKLADDLANNQEYEVYYTDYKNGLAEKLIKNPNVKQIEYNDESEFKLPIEEPVTIITPIYWAHRIPKMNLNSKILFLNWHYCCMPVFKNDSKWSKKLINNLLKLVKKTNSCFFLDYSHLIGQNTNKITFKETFVPITLRGKNVIANKDIINPEEINIGVLGRLDGDKVYSVLNLLDNFANINSSKPVNVHIIGDGVHRKFFEEECKKSNYSNCNINIIMHGIMVNDELNNFMANNIDVLFAMGTSVIEGAAIKLPSVIVPSNCQKFYDNKYVYFHNSIKYCLGWFNTQIPELGISTIKLEDVLDDIYNKNLKSDLGNKAFEYYSLNHKSNIEKFIIALKDSTLKYKDILKLYKQKDGNGLFSIKNNDEKKIIKFLGLKLTLKRKAYIRHKQIINSINSSREEVREELKEETLRKSELLMHSLCYQTNLYNKVKSLHGRVFPKYKNLHEGETAVLIASGPTVNFYNPSIAGSNVKNIAVNGSFAYDKVDFDYLFLQDYSGLKESIAKIPYAKNLQNATKFYGIMSPVPSDMIVPESVAIRDKAQRYYVHSVCYDALSTPLIPRCDYAFDLASEFFMCHGTIPLIAMQFLLYANFKKIYIVGCDCSLKGHFSNNMEKQVTQKTETDVWILGWQKLKKFVDCYYPDTEIISVNPVGLKGLFKDVYTDEYLNSNKETLEPVKAG